MKRSKIKRTNYLFIYFLPLFFIFLLSVGVIFLLNEDNDEITVNSIYVDYEKIKTGEFYSYDDDNYTSLSGIDLSEHNGEVDFEKIKERGIDFVYLRIGWRGYSEGLLYTDNRFEEYYDGAVKNNLKVGVYFFSQAISEEEAKEEAELVLKTLNGRHIDLPIAYDFEIIDYDKARSDNISREQCTKNTLAFLQTVEKKYGAILYGNNEMFTEYLSMSELNDYPLWFAQYYKKPETIYPIFIWQYSESGKIEGINTYTDLNIMFVKKQDMVYPK